jgi:hypothetical protein
MADYKDLLSRVDAYKKEHKVKNIKCKVYDHGIGGVPMENYFFCKEPDPTKLLYQINPMTIRDEDAYLAQVGAAY